MKQRVITAVIALIVFIPLAVIGGTPFDILALILGLIGLSEILVMRKKLLVSPEAIISGLAALFFDRPTKLVSFFANNCNPIHYFLFLCISIVAIHSDDTKSFFFR